MPDVAPEALLYRRACLLVAAAYALFGLGFLLWFGGLVAGFGGAGEAAEVAFLAGPWVGGLGAVAALASAVLAVRGWYTTRRPHPWWLIVALAGGFPLLVGVIYGLYLA